MVAAMSGKPAKAHNFLKALRSFMRYCIAENLRKDEPSSGIKGPKFRTDGYRPWGDEQIEKFRAHHPIGTRARLALELLLNVGARRSDAVRLGPQNLENGEFSYRTQKTLTQIDCVPLLPELTEALDAMPNTNSTFLTTHHGKPFTVAGFGNWFRDVCDQAGISKGYSAHGLRKASATRLADHGATEHQLMAWFGWTTLRSAEQYTRAANKRKLNRAAGEMLKIGISNSKRT